MAAPGNRRFIPEEQKVLVTIMSAHLKNKDISEAMRMSDRTVHWVLKLWHKTGWVIKTAMQAGRPQELMSLEVSVHP